jgi:predicted lipoprotein with Yx(FWY)xxD motif
MRPGTVWFKEMTLFSPATTMIRHRRACRRRQIGGALVALMLLLAACDNSGTAVHSQYGNSKPNLEHGPTYEIKIGNVNGLGPVLVNGQGLTVYLFVPDHQGQSTCYQICAVQWPPVTLPAGVTAPIAGPGIKASLLGTTRRKDGSTEITYNGWPLYRWTIDKSPGQATGQGLNNLGGLWFVVNASGNAVRTTVNDS